MARFRVINGVLYKVVRRRVTLLGSKKEYVQYKERARALATARVRHFAALYGVLFGTITIRNQRTRWGSCSKAGNLNFHYKIALLPPELRDYVIVHEVCHLLEFNHSRRFWALVARTIPTHAKLRALLKKQGV